jgi:uncharacterized protein with FMN-binding domain
VLLAVAGASATFACLLPAVPALAAPNPGQAVANDYGQSDAEVTAEVTAAVNANASVIHSRAVAATDARVVLARAAAEAKAKKAYAGALKSGSAGRIATARRAYLAAHAATVKAKAVLAAAVKARNATIVKVTAAVRATHYRPVDGDYDGRLVKYLVPSEPISFEPMQVHITVYGGHVSDVSVIAQAPALSDSASYNTKSLSTLTLEAMSSGDTANVAAVSGASLSSEAFHDSLLSALVAAGYKG